MPRFFLPGLSGERALICGDDARHITKSLRMRPGDAITLCDGAGFDFEGRILSVGEQVEAELLARMPSRGEPRVRISLYQALPKADKLDFIVQKAAELGAREIIPVLTSRCVSRPDVSSMERKRERLCRTALEAAKQAGRGVVPEVLPMQEFSQAILGMKQACLPILFYERAETPLRELLSGSASERIAVMIGSEGGFSEEEVSLAEAHGIRTASLGGRILRCETAPVCALSAILYAMGEF